MIPLENTFISVTELQKNTKSCLWDINNIWRKIILSNNKPQAILLSLWEFYRLTKWKNTDIFETEPLEDEVLAIKDYEDRKRNGKLELLSSDVFFNSLENV